MMNMTQGCYSDVGDVFASPLGCSTGVVQSLGSIPISDAFLSSYWPAVRAHSGSRLTHKITELAGQRKLPGSRRMIPGHDRSDYLKIKVDTHKEDEEEEEDEDDESLSLPLSQVSSSQGSCRRW